MNENKTVFVVPATRMRVNAHVQALKAEMDALDQVVDEAEADAQLTARS